MTHAVEAQVPALSRMHRWVALLVLLFAQLVLSLDLTVLNVALPSMTADLQPTSDQQLWIVDVYSLVLAGLLCFSKFAFRPTWSQAHASWWRIGVLRGKRINFVGKYA